MTTDIVDRVIQLRWNAACSAQKLLRHSERFCQVGLDTATLVEKLAQGLLDNRHIKLRSQVVDALQASMSKRPPDLSVQGDLKQLLGNLEQERRGASFKQVAAIDQLSAKVSLLAGHWP